MKHLLPGGYLAVDLFFVLSGFVIAHAYQARLDAGLGWLEFMVARLIRLYPLYLLGTLIAITLVVGHRLIHRPDPIGLPSVVAALRAICGAASSATIHICRAGCWCFRSCTAS